MTVNALSDLAKIGTPANLMTIGKRYVEQHDHVRGQQFQPSKETTMLAEVADEAVGGLIEQVRIGEEQANAKLASELQAIDAQIAAAKELPKRSMSQTADEFAATLMKAQIESTRDLRQVLLVQMDVHVAATTSDLDTLTELVGDAIDSGHAERVRRIGRAVSARLDELAADEVRSGTSRVAGDLRISVGQRLSAWRAQEAEKSPDVARERARSQHASLVQDLRSHVEYVAEAVGLGDRLAQRAGGNRFTRRAQQ